MERKEDTVLAESPEDTTERGATCLMGRLSVVEPSSLSTTADDTVSTDEDHPSEIKSEIEGIENFGIRSEKVMKSCDAERVSSYFNIEDEYSHDIRCYSLQLDPPLFRLEKYFECQIPNPSSSCQVKCAMQHHLWKDPEDGVELVKYFFSLTHPLKKHVHVDFVLELYNAKGLYLRNYKTSAVFTEEIFMHECLRIRLSELKKIDSMLSELKLHWAMKGCC